MNSLIVKVSSRVLIMIMLLFSFFLLLRGHNLPGGGFIAGLVTAAAIALYTIAHGVKAARKLMRFRPRMIIGCGLSVAVFSGLFSMITGHPFMTGLWLKFHFSSGKLLPLGTPLLFDLGVYLVVVGSAITVLFALEEEKEWK